MSLLRCQYSFSMQAAFEVRNEEVHRMAGTSEDLTVRMKKNVLSWYGHVERMSDERMAKDIYNENLFER